MGEIKKITLNKSLSDGDFNTEAIPTKGNFSTVEITLDNVSGSGAAAKLQTSPDGEEGSFVDIPDSNQNITDGCTAVRWDIGPYPSETFVRVNVTVGTAAGIVKLLKMRKDGWSLL